jgi:hypothetical protein
MPVVKVEVERFSGISSRALQTWFAIVVDRRLVFVNRDGRPEGHFLYKLKNIALKAGLNCGHCKTGKKDEFGNIIPGTELCCKTSRSVRIGPYAKCGGLGQPCSLNNQV